MTETTTGANSGGLSTTTSDPDERLAYIALAVIPGLGARRLASLLSTLGSARNAVARSSRESPTGDALQRSAMKLARDASLLAAERLASLCDRRGVTMLTPTDDDFPAQLRSIPDPPTLLFARGRLELLDPPAVAIIGSRNHSLYGSDVARMISTAAAAGGIVVVSGMARGLDAVAHAAALDAGGMTTGVLGNGIGVVYPAENAVLYERVEAGGLLLTENPPGERPQIGSFPRRNRLISGLASVVVVVEAAQGSGTLVTVAAALEQGRDVMAIPGPITSPTSVGTNQLLRDGAEPILHPSDLLAKFSVRMQPGPTPLGVADPPVCTLSGDEARALNAITADVRNVDDLALLTGLPVGRLLGVLCGLELGGLVEQIPGGLFRRPPRGC